MNSDARITVVNEDLNKSLTHECSKPETTLPNGRVTTQTLTTSAETPKTGSDNNSNNNNTENN